MQISIFTTKLILVKFTNKKLHKYNNIKTNYTIILTLKLRATCEIIYFRTLQTENSKLKGGLLKCIFLEYCYITKTVCAR